MLKSIYLTLLTFTTFQIFSSVNEFQTSLPQPVQIKEDYRLTETREALKLLNAPKDKLEVLTKSCYSAGFATDIDPVLIACIIRKESEFKINALSPKGYKSLMQGDKAVMQWGYAETNTMYGANILREKLIIAKGDMNKAMVFYKGHGGEESKKFAKEQLEFYRSIKQQIKERMMKG